MTKEKEYKVIEYMIKMYCKGNHNHKKDICEECAELLEYAHVRSQRCPHGKGVDNGKILAKKPYCANCPIHCYKPDMREKIRKVMRYSGPRMIFTHPILAMQHLIESKTQRKKMNKDNDR